MLQRWLVVIIGLPLLLAALLLCPDWVTVIVVCGIAAAAAYELLHTAGKKVPKCVYAFTILAAVAQEWVIYDAHTWQFYEGYQSVGMIRILCVPLVLLTDGLPSLTPLFTQPNILVSWLFLGVFGNAVCFAIWNIAFKRLGVVITNNYLYATPFVTVVAGWLLLGEKISLMCIIGAVLITLGVIFAGKSDS